MRYTFTTDPRELAIVIDYAKRPIAADLGSTGSSAGVNEAIGYNRRVR